MLKYIKYEKYQSILKSANKLSAMHVLIIYTETQMVNFVLKDIFFYDFNILNIYKK